MTAHSSSANHCTPGVREADAFVEADGPLVPPERVDEHVVDAGPGEATVERLAHHLGAHPAAAIRRFADPDVDGPRTGLDVAPVVGLLLGGIDELHEAHRHAVGLGDQQFPPRHVAGHLVLPVEVVVVAAGRPTRRDRGPIAAASGCRRPSLGAIERPWADDNDDTRTRRSEMAELDGMVAIVTGSSSGIGERTAQRLSELGAAVVVNSSSSVEAGERVAAALPGESLYVQGDISDPAQCQALLDATIARFGKLDLLVNNAGWTTVVPHGDLDALTDEIFLQDLRGERVRHVEPHEDGHAAAAREQPTVTSSPSPRSPACARSARRSPTR